MEPKQAPIFVDGVFVGTVSDSAPEYILGKGSIHIKKLPAFIEKHKDYAIKDWLGYIIKVSKNGTRYMELDLYSWKKAQEKANEPKNSENDMTLAPLDAPTINPETGDTIPF